uniref:Uncharacterized protein n=1 Tax=Callithrix jacchus TaxID=9483 RepID=A0A8I4A1B0_CALJA
HSRSLSRNPTSQKISYPAKLSFIRLKIKGWKLEEQAIKNGNFPKLWHQEGEVQREVGEKSLIKPSDVKLKKVVAILKIEDICTYVKKHEPHETPIYNKAFKRRDMVGGKVICRTTKQAEGMIISQKDRKQATLKQVVWLKIGKEIKNLQLKNQPYKEASP